MTKPTILDDRLEITKRDWRVVNSASQCTLSLLWAMGAYIALSTKTDIGTACFWMWTILMIIADVKWYAILRRTYIVPLASHHFIENGEERKHEVAVHGTTVSA